MSVMDGEAGTDTTRSGSAQGDRPSLPAPPPIDEEHVERDQAGPGFRSGEAGSEQEIDAEALPLFAKSLASACAEIDSMPELDGQDSANDEARILRKLEALNDLLHRHGIPFLDRTEHLSTPKTLARIGHKGSKSTARVRAAVARLAKDHPQPAPIFRHNPEREIDRLFDAYEKAVIARGYGLPRFVNGSRRIDRRAAAAEIGCSPDDFSGKSERRLKQIDALMQRPGPVTGRPIRVGGRQRDRINPAVPGLLRVGLRHFEAGLPEDPLHPGKVDLLTVARRCGITIADIRSDQKNFPIIDDARGVVPLVPHPCIAQRRFTFRELLAHGAAERTRTLRRKNLAAGLVERLTEAMRVFTGHVRLDRDDDALVPDDFRERVARAVCGEAAHLGRTWKSDMSLWVGYAGSLRAARPLPEDFGVALRLLMRETGLGQAEIARCADVSRDLLQSWADGLNVPSHNMQDSLERVTVVLGVPSSRLTQLLSSEWRRRDIKSNDEHYVSGMNRHLPDRFEELLEPQQSELIERLSRSHYKQDTEFSRRASAMARDHYLLKRKQWPATVEAAWQVQFPKRKSRKQETWTARRPGEEIAADVQEIGVPRSTRGLRDGTLKFRQTLLEAMLGYFTRPRVLTAAQLDQVADLDHSMTTDFRPTSGLGIPIELINPSILAIPDLISSFIWWKNHRSGGQNKLVLATLALAASFVRPGTGTVWGDEGMIEQLEAFKKWWDNNPHDLSEGKMKLDISAYRKNWKAAVADAYGTLQKDFSRINKGLMPATRDPFLPILPIINDPQPMVKYMEGVYRLLASKPHKIDSRHAHTRDCVLTQILIQTGLRAGTLLFDYDDPATNPAPGSAPPVSDDELGEMRIFKRRDRDGTLTWQIRIAADRFKNYYSSYFQGGNPYEYTLRDEDDLYDRLETYVTQSRPYMLAGRKSKKFFVAHKMNDFNTMGLSENYHRITQYYFLKNPELVSKDPSLNPGEAEEVEPPLMVHGPHAVRHVIATHIVKTTGNLSLAAWAIQDSVKTIEKYYARFFPRDKVVLAMQVLEEARAAARATRDAGLAAKPESKKIGAPAE